MFRLVSILCCAAQAAIHSFTQSLRLQPKHTNIAEFELAPPLTETSLFQDDMRMSDINANPMKVRALVEHALNGINHGLEIATASRSGLARAICS
jgi:uncharacterized oxidoreductase